MEHQVGDSAEEMVDRPIKDSRSGTVADVVDASDAGVVIMARVMVPWADVVPLCIECHEPLDEDVPDMWPGECRKSDCFMGVPKHAHA